MSDRGVQPSGRSVTSKLKSAMGGKGKDQGVPRPRPGLERSPSSLGHDPQLSEYIVTKALKRPDGVSFTDLARALLDAKDRSSDKNFRAQLPALLLRLSFYEEIPSDVVSRLVPLFQVYNKDPRVVRSIFYICGIHVSRGCAGTPTLIDPTLAGRPADGNTLQAVVIEAQRMIQAPDTDPAVRRAAAFLLAAAGRSSDPARVEALATLSRTVNAADALASAAGSYSARGKGGSGAYSSSSAANWELQHTVFAAARMSDAPAATIDIAGGCFMGVGSPDPAGARHALALASELSLRDPGLVIRELTDAVNEAADCFEAAGPCPPRQPGQGINLEDAFARAHLARTCAQILHSDQGAGDISRGGAPFWRMLCLLSTRDPSDLVRFAALEAMTGAITTPGQATLGASQTPSAREAAVLQQRRARAWRLLASQAAAPVIIPGVSAEGGMKLIDVVGRLLVLALSKVESAARFCVAASVASSLSESCLASQVVGTSRHISSPEIDKVMTILSKELGSLMESPLKPAQRCGCAEALLYLKAAGYQTALTPAKLAQAGGRGGGGTQDSLLGAVLKCARARPKEAASFLGFAAGVVGIAPSGIDLAKVTQLWDTAAAGGKEGRGAALVAALEALRSPAPPSTRPKAGAGAAEVARAAREDSGWSAFVATATWWLGENANSLCEEYAGRKVQPIAIAGGTLNAGEGVKGDIGGGGGGAGTPVSTSKAHNKVSYNGSDSDSEMVENGVDENGVAGDSKHAGGLLSTSTTSHAAQQALLDRHSGRNVALSRVISVLHEAALTSAWQLRVAAARALAKIAVRSGEPFRLQCYGILTACRVSGGRLQDALGLQSVVGPALAVLDKIYATQAKLESLFAELGDDVEGWPPEIIASLARRNAELRLAVERTVCSAPREQFSLLGLKAATVLAHAEEEGPAYAAFLSPTGESTKEAATSAGPNLTAAKNREVEDILSFGGSEDVSSFKFFPERETSAAAADRDVEIENMLSGRVPSTTDAWAFTPAASTDDRTFNAFAETPRGGGGAVSSGAASPRALGFLDLGGGSSPRAAAAASAASGVAPAPASPKHAQQEADAVGTARIIGAGTMVHTFIADANNPEELSIFEGDRVDVLEESDGWLLVRDPSGSQGLVPTAYVNIERLFIKPTGGGGEGTGSPMKQGSVDVWASMVRTTSALSSPVSPQQRAAHARGGSVEFIGSGVNANEDYLDQFFTSSAAGGGGGIGGGGGPAAAPGMPEGQAWGAPLVRSPSRSASGSPRKMAAAAAASTSRFSPTWRQDSLPAGTDATGAAGGGAGAQQPAGNPFGGVGGGVLGGGSGGGAPVHRRMASTASSHQRTLSGGSDIYGSMPGTPSRIEGPERSVAASFVAEMDGELSVEPGDRVKVHSEVGGWARVLRISDLRAGLVPSWAVGGE